MRDTCPVERIRRLAERARTERADLDAVLGASLTGTFATVVDGRLPHALLLEMLTSDGTGTMVVP